MQPYFNIVKDKDKVLDLGCGNGRIIKGINKQIDYTGVDFSEGLVKIAEKEHSRAQFIVGDITCSKLWKKLKKYDVVFCIAVLHHIGDRKKQLFILRQVKAALKPNGRVVLSVWNLWQKQYLKRHLSIQSLKLKLKGWRYLWFPFQNEYQRFCVAMGKRYLYSLFKEVGFEEVEIKKMGKNIWIKAS